MENSILDEIEEAPEIRQRYTSLGGWLVIPLFGLFTAPVTRIYQVIKELLPAINPSVIDKFTNPESYLYNPALAYIIYGEFIFNIAFSIFAVIILYYMFKLKKEAPRLFIIYIIGNLVFILLDSLSVALVAPAQSGSFFTRDMLSAIIAVAIWVPYFLTSDRVKGTFVL